MPFIEQVCQNIAILDEGVIDLAGDLADKTDVPSKYDWINLEEEGHRVPADRTAEILRNLMATRHSF